MRMVVAVCLALIAPLATRGEETPDVPRPLSASLRMVRAVAVSPDNSMVAMSCVDAVHLFQLDSGAHQRSLSPIGESAKSSGLIEALAFSPDGQTLAAGGYQEVLLWDVESGSLRRRIGGFADRVLALTFSPDGKRLAAGGGVATVDGELKLIDVAGGDITHAFPKSGFVDAVYGVTFSPDGTKLAAGSADKSVRVFDASSGELLKTFQGHIHHVLDVAWGAYLVSAGADGVLKVWDYDSSEEIAKLSTAPMGGKKNAQPTVAPKEFSRMVFASGGTMLVTCGGDGTARLWDIGKAQGKVGRGPVRTFEGNSSYLSAVGISVNGQLIAVGGEEGVVRLYDCKSGAVLQKLQAPPGAYRKK